MTPEIIFFIFGAFLILIGLLGGGFEVRDLKIPKVGSGVRILAFVGGSIFISLGIGIQSDGSTLEAPNSNELSSPVNFKITDDLGEGEASEQLIVLINGRRVGELTVNEDFPRSSIMVTVPEEGTYSYTLDASAVLNNQGAQTVVSGVGQGMINVKQEKVFTAESSFSGQTWIATLVEGS